MSARRLAIIVLAGGKGTRMADPMLPKVLVPFHRRPLIVWVIDAIAASDLGVQPLVVLGYGAEQVRAIIGAGYDTVVQHEQRGTGDAVRTTRDALRGTCDDVLVLYGDHPLLSGATIRRIVDTHWSRENILTLATAAVPDFNNWRQPFADFGRIVRDADGRMVKSVEVALATPEERMIREVNPCFFCFRADWLWSALDLLSDANAKHEFLLTDLVAIAIAQGYAPTTVPLENPREALGVNTPDQLRTTEAMLHREA